MTDSIDTIAERITNLTTYGIRKVTAENRAYVLTWFNSSAKWCISARRIAKGEQLTLDANQCLAYAFRKDLELMINLLPALPLYANSYEAVRCNR